MPEFQPLPGIESVSGLDGLIVRGAPSNSTNCYWATADALLWWGKGMRVPPLVTTNPTQWPDLGEDGTTILFGNETVTGEIRPGIRVRLGKWLRTERQIGIEAEYFYLGRERTDFFAEGDGTGDLIGRPFFNINPRDGDDYDPPAREDAELVSGPGLAGSVHVIGTSEVCSGGLRLIFPFCCKRWDGCSVSWNLLAGYRFFRVSETLSISENLLTLGPPAPEPDVTFDIVDAFHTDNEFHGADFGILVRHERGRGFMEVLGKVAMGNVREMVHINGRTIISGSATSDGFYRGGLLTQTTNIGFYKTNQFAMIPEFNINLGYNLNDRWSATCGYSLIYLSRAVRPGEQIDLDVNPDYLPPPFVPLEGAARPRFASFDDTDFWVQGLNLGLEYCY